MMNEFRDRLKKSFEQKPAPAKKKQKGDKVRKTELTPYQQWSRSLKNGTTQTQTMIQTEYKQRTPFHLKHIPVFSRRPFQDVKNVLPLQTRNMTRLIQQRPTKRSIDTGRLFQKIHFVALPGKENIIQPVNGMVPMLAIPLGPVTNSQHISPIYQIQKPPCHPGQMQSLPILHPVHIEASPDLYEHDICDFSSDPFFLPPFIHTNDLESPDDHSLSELFPSIEDFDCKKLDELIEEAEAAEVEELSFHTLPDVLNTSLANALNLSIKEETFDDDDDDDELFQHPFLSEPKTSPSRDSQVKTNVNRQEQIPLRKESHVPIALCRNVKRDFPQVQLKSPEATIKRNVFSDSVIEINGKTYVESSNVRKSFSQFLLEDSEPMNEDGDDDLTSSGYSTPVSDDTPLIDPDLAYTLSESHMVADIGHSSFYDILQNGGETLKEEKHLAKEFLKVFENVERLVIENKYNKKELEERIYEMERECEIVFEGQEAWLTDHDLQNEVQEINMKSDIVYRVPEVEQDEVECDEINDMDDAKPLLHL